MNKHRYVINCIRITITILVICVALHLAFTYKVYEIQGESMEPGYRAGDMVIISICSIEQVEVGDVVVYTDYNKNTVIHRVIGTTIDIRGNKYLYTMGDNNESMDTMAVSNSMIIGKCIYKIRM